MSKFFDNFLRWQNAPSKDFVPPQNFLRWHSLPCKKIKILFFFSKNYKDTNLNPTFPLWLFFEKKIN
jgi:hypothetical protein